MQDKATREPLGQCDFERVLFLSDLAHVVFEDSNLLLDSNESVLAFARHMGVARVFLEDLVDLWTRKLRFLFSIEN